MFQSTRAVTRDTNSIASNDRKANMHINTPQAADALEALALDIPSHLYKGAGRCWVAIKESQIVAVRMMGDCPNDCDFAQFRAETRAELAQAGDIWSGMASGCQFYPKESELLARLLNAAATGDQRGLEVK
jgi:hypothetical protein